VPLERGEPHGRDACVVRPQRVCSLAGAALTLRAFAGRIWGRFGPRVEVARFVARDTHACCPEPAYVERRRSALTRRRSPRSSRNRRVVPARQGDSISAPLLGEREVMAHLDRRLGVAPVLLTLCVAVACTTSPAQQKGAGFDYGRGPEKSELLMKERFSSGFLTSYAGEPVVWQGDRFWGQDPPQAGGRFFAGHLVVALAHQSFGRPDFQGQRLYAFIVHNGKIVKEFSPSLMNRVPIKEMVGPLPFDERKWEVGDRQDEDTRTVTQYVLPGETVERWTERVTLQTTTRGPGLCRRRAQRSEEHTHGGVGRADPRAVRVRARPPHDPQAHPRPAQRERGCVRPHRTVQRGRPRQVDRARRPHGVGQPVRGRHELSPSV